MLIEDLRKRLEAGKVIVVAGSGVASAATGGSRLASWSGLIESGLEHVENLPGYSEARVQAARTLLKGSDPGSLILAAEALTESLGGRGGGEYGRWLSETAGSLKLKDRSLPAAIVGLGAPVTTTNYDGLIEEVSGWERVSWDKPARVQLALQGAEQTVVHLHGHWRDPESVILGVRSYEQVVNDAPAQALQHAAAAMTTLLFIGVGDGVSDPNFGALRGWLKTSFPGSQIRHYRLCLDTELEGLSAEHAGDTIVPLVYGADHHELAGFLEALGADGTTVRPVHSPTVQQATTSGSLPPRPVTMGRDDEISALALGMIGEPPPMLLLLGAPGIGKTNLTLAATHDQDVVRKFGARRWFVRCDATASASELIAQIASVLGLPLGGDVLTSMLAYLSAAPGLIALDNLETPWETDTLAIEELLGRLAGTGATIVASLRGLERPGGVKWSDPLVLEALDGETARHLFLSISSSAFEGPGLDGLLEEMGGVPLAIELLAHASEGEIDLDHLVSRWHSERTRLLKRQQASHRLLSVAVSIDLSWNSKGMTEPARRLLSLMGQLPNGIAEEDLEKFLPGDGPGAASCLRRRGLAFDQAGRLRALPPIRHHVADTYPPEPEDWSRLSALYMARAIQVDSLVGRADGGDATRRLASEAANVSAVVKDALRGSPATLEFAAAQAYINIATFVGLEAFDLARTVVTAAEKTGDARTTAVSHQRLAILALRVSDHDTARAALEQALLLFKQTGDIPGQATCMKDLGRLAFRHSELDPARELYEQARDLFREVGEVLGQANCIESLGELAVQRAEHDTARAAFEQARDLHEQVDNALGEANCIQGLGDVAYHRSEHDAARANYEQARDLHQQVGNVLGEANCIQAAGEIAFQLSDDDAASTAFGEALLRYEEIGNVVGQANCIKGAGELASRRSEHAAARAAYEQARDLYKQISSPLGEANCLVALASTALNQSEYGASVDALEQALAIYRNIRSVRGEANCARGLGEVALRQDDVEGARSAFARAAEQYAEIEDSLSSGGMHEQLAHLATDKETRCFHAQTAHKAWSSLDRDDLISYLADNFGPCFEQ